MRYSPRALPAVMWLTVLLLPFLLSTDKRHFVNSDDYSFLKYKGAVLTHIHRIGSGYGSDISRTMHKHLNTVGYNTVQLNTFAYMKHRAHVEIYTNGDPTMKHEYITTEIENLHSLGFKVMLKPHIWIGGYEFDPNNWRSKIDFENPGERTKWFSNYSKFIIAQAKLAQETGVDIFVIGTELVGMSKFAEEWEHLIGKVRSIYKGKLTYAAEGMNASKIKFWDKLDYIGIDAYFPLVEHNAPSLDELIQGWDKYEPEIEKLATRYNKRIIFTEIGYKSVEGTAVKPWEWSQNGKPSQEEQALAFEAAFRVFKDNRYLAGLFIWKYFTDMNSYEKANVEKGFTPYGKKTEEVISRWINHNGSR